MSREKKKNSYLFAVIFTIVIIALLLASFMAAVKINEAEEERDAYNKDLAKVVSERERKEHEVNQELTEDKIKELAKDELSLVDPNEEIYIATE